MTNDIAIGNEPAFKTSLKQPASAQPVTDLADDDTSSLNEIAGRLDLLLQRYANGHDDTDQPLHDRETLQAQRPVSPAAPSDVTSPDELNKSNDAELQPNGHAAAPPEPDHMSLNSSFVPDELKGAKIMLVDDEEVNVLAVRMQLEQVGFTKFVVTADSREAVELLRQEQPDVVLLDIQMPNVSGLDILRIIGHDSVLKHIPVIVLTASLDGATKRKSLELGANDFLIKPVDPSDLTFRVRNALVAKKHYDHMVDQKAEMEQLVSRRTAELFQSRRQLILSLARAAEHRDNDTGNHVIRVGRYAAIIADELGWSQERTEMIEQAAQLHDVGKIGIPDSILFKPGKLDPQEFDLIRKHCAIGFEIIEPLEEMECRILRTHARLGQKMLHIRSSPLLLMASRIAQTHHERWDGRGYPLGLSGEDIPLEGRVTSVADVFDALSSKRPYKEPFPREKCFKILEEGRGTQFDPQVLDAFFARSSDIIQTQMALMDRD